MLIDRTSWCTTAMWLRQRSSTVGAVAGCAAEPMEFAAEPVDFTGKGFTNEKLVGANRQFDLNKEQGPTGAYN